MNAPPITTEGRDAKLASPSAAENQLPFRIENLQSVSYGSKTAEFLLRTELGGIECDLFRPEQRAPFVCGRSIRNKFDGQWKRTVSFDKAFAQRVLAEVLRATGEALEPPPQPAAKPCIPVNPSEAPSCNDWANQQEARFDEAFTSLRSGAHRE